MDLKYIILLDVMIQNFIEGVSNIIDVYLSVTCGRLRVESDFRFVFLMQLCVISEMIFSSYERHLIHGVFIVIGVILCVELYTVTLLY